MQNNEKGSDSMLKKNIDFIASYYLYFMMYAILGWCYEVFLEVVVYRWGFTNRGVLFGPYCPIYGFGALIFLFTVRRFMKTGRPILWKLLEILGVFLGCMLIASSIELATSYILEAITGAWPWQTYVDYKINFQGRIALSPSLRFGLGGLLFLYVLQPIFEKTTKCIGQKKIYVAAVVFVLFAVDFLQTILL